MNEWVNVIKKKKRIQTKDQVKKKSQRDKSKWNKPNRAFRDLDSVLWAGGVSISVWLGCGHVCGIQWSTP